jgi:hypothetical protein
MPGTGSPERDLVDAQLGLARDQVNGLPEGRDKALAALALHLAEALVRQIRDLDDDVWHLKGAIEAGGADQQIILNNIGAAIESIKSNEPKRGLFG